MAYTDVTLKGTPVKGEKISSGIIKPGMVCDINSSDLLIVHGTPGGNMEAIVAHKDGLRGKGITDAYASGDLVQYGHYRPGDEAAILIANLVTTAIGSWLESNADGTLKLVSTDQPSYQEINSLKWRACEVVTGDGATVFCKCRCVA